MEKTNQVCLIVEHLQGFHELINAAVAALILLNKIYLNFGEYNHNKDYYKWILLI
jgi:hypothetical protein